MNVYAEPELWKRIDLITKRHYEVSSYGNIRRIYDNGKILQMKLRTRDGNSDGRGTKITVKLTTDADKAKEYMVSTLVGLYFIRKPKPGEVLYHKNTITTENYYRNLVYIDRRTLGKLTGAQSKRRPVIRINIDGEIVGNYPSARACAKSKEVFLSYQTVIDSCNRRNKSPFASDGYVYAWDDRDNAYEKALIRIKEYQLNQYIKPIDFNNHTSLNSLVWKRLIPCRDLLLKSKYLTDQDKVQIQKLYQSLAPYNLYIETHMLKDIKPIVNTVNLYIKKCRENIQKGVKDNGNFLCNN